MSYYIDIIDTLSPVNQLIFRYASRSGIVLEWSGSDAKDELSIVASNLRFDLLSKDARDAAYLEMFSGDEHRFKVEIKKSSNDAIIWQGHIIPDLYSEPYKNGSFFVNFTATDGLGRLKGKYLSEDFYDREKSLIAIFSEILRLTGLQLDLFFLPAIENRLNKNWNTIYIDTASFLDKSKKLDAYKVFEMLLQDTLCVCYQADNRWYIEGINQRHIRKVTYSHYDYLGNYMSLITLDRLIKQITPLVTPIISITPPYNEITVTHKQVEPFFPKTICKESNNGWAVVFSVVPVIHVTEWMSNGGIYAKCIDTDLNVTIFNKSILLGNGSNINYPQDDTQWISLKKKIFFSKGQKVKLDFGFAIRKMGLPDNMNRWKNPLKYEITFNGINLYSNFGGTVENNENLIFSESYDAKLEFEHIFTEDGLLDIKLYGPPGASGVTRVLGVEIREAKIEVINFKEELKVTDLINGDFTVDKTIELTYGDDKSGFSDGFRLTKLKEETNFFNTIEVPILYGIELSGKKYSVVQLEGANLIDENKNQVFFLDNVVQVNEVIYNFNQGGEMVVETDVAYTSGSFFVKKYKRDDVISDRTHWTQWTDAIYQIEKNTYIKTVANIYRRMFNVAVEKIDLTAFNAVKFNDVILFKYISKKDFTVLNCTWDLDANKTQLVLGRSYYKDSGTNPGDDNVPPIVEAGQTVYINDTQTSASLLAEAYDPDGYIATQVWSVIKGNGSTIVSPLQLATDLQGLSEDFYTYKIEVADNDGATANDTVDVVRIKNYVVTLDLVEETTNSEGYQEINRKYKLNVTPELLPGFVIKFTGILQIHSNVSGTYGVSGNASYIVYKNGAIIGQDEQFSGVSNINLTLNYIASDAIYIQLGTTAIPGDSGSGDTADVYASVKINTGEITTGVGNIVGLPIFHEQEVNVVS